LSSITGNTVNLNVEGNTNLKGSLIAAGNFDESGNFVDNSQLDFSTGTITYSSLSSTHYSNSNSFGTGTEFSSSGSSDISFSTQTGYSSEKTLATVGQGTLTIKDKDNSDEIDTLNRDTNNINKQLYDTSTGVSVEATLDHKLLSEDGIKDIAGDFFITGNLANFIFNAITKESQSVGDISRNYQITQAVQETVSIYPELFAEYNDPDIPIDRKNELDAQITNMILTYAGYTPVSVLGMNNDIENKDGNIVQGYYDKDTDTIFLNNGYVLNADQSVYTLGHEAAGHAIEHQENKNYASEYLSEENANIMANYVTRATNFALWQSGQGGLSTDGYANSQDITKTIENNNLLFGNVDKSNGQSLGPMAIAIPVVEGASSAEAMTIALPYAVGTIASLSFAYFTITGLEIQNDITVDPEHPYRTIGSMDTLPPINIFPVSDDALLNQSLSGIGEGQTEPTQNIHDTPSTNTNKDDNIIATPGEHQTPTIETVPVYQDGSGNIVYSDYTNKPKQKANTADIGDILRTPDTYPEDFARFESGGDFINVHTGEIWSKSHTAHSDKDGEWKIGLGNKVKPSTNKKITVGKDGKIIKVDNK
ncbi:MAG: hypothetical protein LBH46_01040, partial [Rickettsiales bacterium]|nr:hypothetical protein [Rickettsiales bacterium]